MASANSTLWDMPLIEYAHYLNNLGHVPPNSTRTQVSIQYPGVNEVREMVATQLWGEGKSYGELRELYAITGDEIYLERMLEKVDE